MTKDKGLKVSFKKLTNFDFPLNLEDDEFRVVNRRPIAFGDAAEGDSKFRATPRLFYLEGPRQYRLFTFWGYGSNSYAFYHARVAEAGEMYLRIPYGGAYMDPQVFGPLLVRKLEFYDNLFNRLALTGRYFHIAENMGDVRICIWPSREPPSGTPLVSVGNLPPDVIHLHTMTNLDAAQGELEQELEGRGLAHRIKPGQE
ncbi:MAG: hypothetical protein IT288_09250 [Bdellovibrionales bacterium]|nr:hypothetical protein [Bdellovibrionales bacterium]